MMLLAQNAWTTLLILVGLVAAVVILAMFAVFVAYFRLWIQSFLTHAGIGFLDLLGMSFRKVSPKVIVRSKIMAVQAGLDDDEALPARRSKRTIWPVATCRW